MSTQTTNPSTQPRQRLLYLHARTPSVFSEILGYTPIEPVKGFRPEITAEELDWPYNTIHDAIVDGWQIVQFPHHQAPYDDRDLDVVGYEFILQKMEIIFPMTIDKKYLLTDSEVANFIVTGYHIVELDLPAERNENIALQLDALESNPGDAITDTVPELHQVLEHPSVQGVLQSLLGHNYEIKPHRHWHCKQPNSGHMQWHQDSVNSRDTSINRFLGLYYPRDITPDMGPTIIVPGTQFRNAPTDRMATYTNIRGQIPLIVKAGTIAFTHYDLWHGTAANRSSVKRHMIKFLFGRTQENTEPTWNHDPKALNAPRDWNKRDKAEDANNVLTFGNPLRVSQSDHYKERQIRRQCWNQLMGKAG